METLETKHIKENKCNICNKIYSTSQNLWKHNNKFHNNNSANNTPKPAKNSPDSAKNVSINNEIKCEYCKSIFTRKDSLKKHYNRCNEKKCNNNKINEQTEKLKEENELLKKEMNIMKEQLMILIKKSCKIHPKTLQKINNTLNNNSNNTVNNTYIVQFGREKLYEVFTKKEQIDVLNCGNLCLENLIEKAHFNAKYPQFKNILITNLQNNLAYKYNAETNNFDVLTKKELLEDIISERMFDIEEFFNNYKDDITPKMQMVIENFIKKMDTESYEDIKKQNIKIILYNNRSLVDKANIII